MRKFLVPLVLATLNYRISAYFQPAPEIQGHKNAIVDSIVEFESRDGVGVGQSGCKHTIRKWPKFVSKILISSIVLVAIAFYIARCTKLLKTKYHIRRLAEGGDPCNTGPRDADANKQIIYDAIQKLRDHPASLHQLFHELRIIMRHRDISQLQNIHLRAQAGAAREMQRMARQRQAQTWDRPIKPNRIQKLFKTKTWRRWKAWKKNLKELSFALSRTLDPEEQAARDRGLAMRDDPQRLTTLFSLHNQLTGDLTESEMNSIVHQIYQLLV